MKTGLHCPVCASSRLIVKDTRPADNGVLRRRLCRACGSTFGTMERVSFVKRAKPATEKAMRDAA